MNPEAIPLRDIHLPQAISWWPPASGWWWLSGGLLTLLLIIGFWRWWRARPPSIQQLALRELRRLRVGHGQHRASRHELLIGISTLLRRVMMSRHPRESAGLTGHDWLTRLHAEHRNALPPALAQAILTAPYQAQPAVEPAELLAACERWLRQLPPPKR